MSKDDSSDNAETRTDIVPVDTDSAPAANSENETGDAAAEVKPVPDSKPDSRPETESTAKQEPEPESTTEPVAETKAKQQLDPESTAEPEPEPVSKTPQSTAASAAQTPPKPRRSWFGFFNFLLILLLGAGGGYYWWQQQQLAREYQATIDGLKQELDTKIGKRRLESDLTPLKSEIGGLEKKLKALEFEQLGLRTSSEKLYELYGRDKNGWQLAEVEYLLRVAQHKLILQDDFEGAAITLQAGSDLIGLTGDPGLLPVRLLISEEIADLKTRRRPDLVGTTLILAQLGRQLRGLQPGFAVRVDDTSSKPAPTEASGDWIERLKAFFGSLVTVRNEVTRPSRIEANKADVGDRLADNLKLAHWAVLERDNNQYQQLIEQSLQMFREFYDLDDVANHDFMAQLQNLKKMVLQPEKPEIGGSLRELQRILKQRENAPADAPATPREGNG